jgi:hypothetical protein
MPHFISPCFALVVGSLLLAGCGESDHRQAVQSGSAPTVSPDVDSRESRTDQGALGEVLAVARDPEAASLPSLIDELAELADDDDLTKMLYEPIGPLTVESDLMSAAEAGKDKASNGMTAARELVRRGVDALLELLRHVDDHRPSRVTISPLGPIGSFSFTNWYSPRFTLNRKRHPADIAPTEDESTPSVDWRRSYTITIGDLCYFVIGQIVNRELRIIHPRMTQAYVITSPTATPALAAAVRADWSGITAAKHRQSLMRDAAQSPNPGAAVERLMAYYPDDGERTVLELLQRPLFWNSPAEDLVRYGLMPIDDPQQWRRVIDEYRGKFGKRIDADLPWVLDEIASRNPQRRDSDVQADYRRRARHVLDQFYPSFDPEIASPPTSATYRGQASIVSGLRRARASEKLDAAVYRLFMEAEKAASGGDVRMDDFDLLAIACISRLAGGTYDAPLRDFVGKRIAEVEQRPSNRSAQRTLQTFRTLEGRLVESDAR